MRILFPEIEPYTTHNLAVGDGHTLHVEECGTPEGIPICVVHGGPGGGCPPTYRRFFDPGHTRAVLFDQRGCGKSTPHLELTNNTTQHLVADMEAIREALNIDKWILFGGSWGSTLSLVYAQTHPDKVYGLILRGIFLCRDEDIHWFYQSGADHIFPDHWQAFLDHIPEDKRDSLVDAYYDILTGEDEVARMAAGKAWSNWEAQCITLEPNPDLQKILAEPRTAMSLALIECHYFKHKAFLEPNQILNNMDKIAHLPGIIVQGRYDIVCPPNQAFALQQHWPNGELQMVRNAGHAATEPGILDGLIRASLSMTRTIERGE